MEDASARLLSCPVGCAFLLTIARDRIPVSLAVTSPQAFARAAAALRALNPWSPQFEQALNAALARGSQLEALAHEVVAHPAADWWTARFERSHQVMIMTDAMDRETRGAAPPKVPSEWETYAERPVGWRITSTLVQGRSCLDTVIVSGVGEWSSTSPHRRLAVVIEDSARVCEIVSPDDWHDLCRSFPRINQQAESPAGAGTLVPDWGRAAKRWDGVHLTFLGLLTVPFVRHRSSAGTTMMWSWDSEGTMWLHRDLLRVTESLGPLDYDASSFRITASLWLDE